MTSVNHSIRETSETRPTPSGEWDGVSRAAAFRELLNPRPRPMVEPWWRRFLLTFAR